MIAIILANFKFGGCLYISSEYVEFIFNILLTHSEYI